MHLLTLLAENPTTLPALPSTTAPTMVQSYGGYGGLRTISILIFAMVFIQLMLLVILIVMNTLHINRVNNNIYRILRDSKNPADTSTNTTTNSDTSPNDYDYLNPFESTQQPDSHSEVKHVKADVYEENFSAKPETPPPTISDYNTLKNNHSATTAITGLQVNSSSHYGSSSVSFDAVESEQANLLLKNDMTITPMNRLFNTFNNPSFFTNNDFTLVFDFYNSNGARIKFREQIKLVNIQKPAIATKSDDTWNTYVLKEKGVIIVEEKF